VRREHTDSVDRASVKKPNTIVYGIDDVPPRSVLWLSGLQHVGLVSIFLLVPVLACREAGLPPEKIIDVLSLSMLVMAVGPVLQSLSRGPIGSGFLCPPIFAAAYLPASLLALKAGGLALMFGMTVFAGLVEIALSRLLRPLRPFLPPEVAGFVVAMIGVTIGMLGFRNMFGAPQPGNADSLPLLVGTVTLATMVALNVWTKGPPKLFCALIGMAVGYLVAIAGGMLSGAELERLNTAPMVHLPSLDHLAWSFDAALVVPFAVGAFAATLRAMGDITICQKTNDAEWIRPELRSISGGAMANGVSTFLAGWLGTIGINTSTSNVGLAAATGITSRKVAFTTGAIYLVLAFTPKAATIFAIMPGAVVGATLVFASALVFVNGIMIITSRMLDSRRIFVIGLSFMVGMTVDVFPGFYGSLSPELRVVTSSSLVLGTLTALILNLFFRIGVRRVQTLVVGALAFDRQGIGDFMDAQGGAWGARRDVIERARFSLMQALETIIESCSPQGRLEVEASFDEFNLDVRVSYAGAPLELSDTRPSNQEIIDSEAGQRRLAGYLLRQQADRVQTTHKDGRTTLLLHFDH
jgi:NCS2 family nucleobase:cation symporter-2